MAEFDTKAFLASLLSPKKEDSTNVSPWVVGVVGIVIGMLISKMR